MKSVSKPLGEWMGPDRMSGTCAIRSAGDSLVFVLVGFEDGGRLEVRVR